MKHIIVAVDGTGRKGQDNIEVEENTNVYRTYQCINNSKKDEGNNNNRDEVHSLYLPGVGTTGWLGKRLVDQVTGKGTSGNIREAYRFICKNHAGDDEIYLIGYSRGAFAARCVADLIFKIGILTYNDSCGDLMGEVFKRWKSGEQHPLAGLNLIPASQKHVKVCVLWDTVSSVTSSLSRVVDSNVQGADFNFHAVALHERRKYYLPIVMRPTGTSAVIEEQCWFNGYHGDVGGGRKKNALGNIALAWALAKLDRDLKPDWEALKASNNSQNNWKLDRDELKLDILDTVKGGFRVVGIKDRLPKLQFWNASTPCTLPINQATYDINSEETIHSTVRYLSEYMPKEPEGLIGATRPITPPLRWGLYGTDFFKVNEAVVSREERIGLIAWLERNLRELNRVARLGQPPPHTIIAQLLAELRG